MALTQSFDQRSPGLAADFFVAAQQNSYWSRRRQFRFGEKPQNFEH